MPAATDSVRLLVRELVEQQQVEGHERGRNSGCDRGCSDLTAVDQDRTHDRENAQPETGCHLSHSEPRQEVGVGEHAHRTNHEDRHQRRPDLCEKPNPNGKPHRSTDHSEHEGPA